MARSTEEGNKRIWIASRSEQNSSLQAQGFSDTLEDGAVTFTAEGKRDAFVSGKQFKTFLACASGVKTAEEAIEEANQKGI